MYQKALTLRNLLMVAPMFYNVHGERARQGKILDNVQKLIDEEKLKILKDEKQFSYEEIRQAHEYIEAHKAFGKVSLVNNL
jgi:NADPH2:quinone reductase